MAGKPIHTQDAQQMLDSFTSVGARQFDLTSTDLQGHKLLFRRGLSHATLCSILPDQLTTSMRMQQNIIIRPHADKIIFVQLDDLKADGINRIHPVSFLTIETSPGNYQAWLALQPAADNDFIRRLRKGAGADPSASGATRLAGSHNFKEKYAPNFPLVKMIHTAHGLLTTCDQLEKLGLIVPLPLFPSNPIRHSRPVQCEKRWPSYDLCLAGAPQNRDQSGPDKSRADFTWCMIAIDWGRGVDETATQLLEVSSKARENGERYAQMTAARAAEAAARNRQAERCHGHIPD